MSDVNEATMLDMSDDDILNMSQPPELTVEQSSNTEGQDTLASGSDEETVSGSADETIVEQEEEKPESSGNRSMQCMAAVFNRSPSTQNDTILGSCNTPVFTVSLQGIREQLQN